MSASNRLAAFAAVRFGDEIPANTDLTARQAAVFIVESAFNYRPENAVLLP